jgi:hypothetical protein
MDSMKINRAKISVALMWSFNFILCCLCIILFYLGFVLVAFVWCFLKIPLYYASLNFVLSLCCTKDRTWISMCMGTCEFPSVPNVITQHMLGSWVSDITFLLFINVTSIFYLPEHQTALHARTMFPVHTLQLNFVCDHMMTLHFS